MTKKRSGLNAFNKKRGKKGLFNAFDKKKGKGLFNAFDKKKGKGLFNAFDKKKGKGLFNAFDKKQNGSRSIESYGGLGGFLFNLFNPAGDRAWHGFQERGFRNTRENVLYFILQFDKEEDVINAFKTMSYDAYQKGGHHRENRTNEREEWALDRWRELRRDPNFLATETQLKTLPRQDAEDYLQSILPNGKLDKSILYYFQDLVYKGKR